MIKTADPAEPVQATSPTPSRIVENARAMVPHLRARIAETERLRKLPEETMKEAAEAGIFSLFVPKSLGGAGGGVGDFVEMVKALAQGHLSAAWTLAFLAEHGLMLARYPEEAQKEIFAEGSDALMSGVIHPPGTAVPVEGGYEVSGYWGYATAVQHADWVQVFAKVEGREGETLLTLLKREDVEVVETWDMSGMGGTGSHHVRTEGAFVPEYRTLDMDVWSSRGNPGAFLHPEAVYSYALRDVLGFMYPAMAVGAAESIIADYRQRLENRRAPFSSLITADSVGGQMRYARCIQALRLAQATLKQTVDEVVEANATIEGEFPPEMRASVKLGLMGVLRMAWEAVDLAVKGSGTSVFKNDHPMQYYIRDLEMLLSHQTIDEDAMLGMTGQILLGRATQSTISII
ncbi:acyl-CoA dehydrogenase family protein [Amycolatopsis sp. H20-H5]|uniref:acyl-CoA dehydrogenase family protein n=1 Tax=Amycolatopsis sp. H20-H5 TaxID=3046309 RepID=UPI002DC057FC|nr:acyl-CoA dehydrogenase family protein [Amycolatopsis sp. H20-H5]MEC3975741.1 acyl-CoA dehydrogenase family protein [Amycolatopsis sp. H20-H5]